MNARVGMQLVIAVAAASLSAPAWAHTLSVRFGAWLGPFLHPLSALDHALAFLALGLLAGQHTAAVSRRTVIAFALALMIGVALPMLLGAHDIPHIGSVNIASLFVLGLAVALAKPLPPVLLAIVAVLFGFSHGLENGADMRVGANAAAAILGVAGAGLLVAAAVAALVRRLPLGAARIGVRIAGSWIAAIGLMMLGLQLRSWL